MTLLREPLEIFSIVERYPRIFLVFVGFMVLIPFVNRPLFVDDHAHFEEALDLINSPFLPYQISSTQMGWVPGNNPSEANPPGYFYLVASLIRIFGPQPWKIHLVFITFHLIGLASFYEISKRFVNHPLWASLLWLVSPQFWITANSLLIDALLAPFGMVALWMWIKGWDSKNKKWLLVSSLFLGLTVFIKYTGVLIWGVAVLWLILFKGAQKISHIFFSVLPALIPILWGWWSMKIYGQSHFGAVAQSSMVIPSASQIFSFLAFVGGAMPFLGLAVFQMKQQAANFKLVYVLFILIISGIVGIRIGPDVWTGMQIGFWAGLCLSWGALIAKNVTLTRKRLFLIIWTVGGLVGLLVARGWVCARYFVIVSPAMVLLTVDTMASSRRMRIYSICGLGFFGLILAHADYYRASIDKKINADLNPVVKRAIQQHKAFYPAATLSGLGFYLNKKYWIAADNLYQLQKGEILVLPLKSLSPRFFPKVKKPLLLQELNYESFNPARILDRGSKASFYGSIWGPIPFSFSTESLEQFVILQESADPIPKS